MKAKPVYLLLSFVVLIGCQLEYDAATVSKSPCGDPVVTGEDHPEECECLKIVKDRLLVNLTAQNELLKELMTLKGIENSRRFSDPNNQEFIYDLKLLITILEKKEEAEFERWDAHSSEFHPQSYAQDSISVQAI